MRVLLVHNKYETPGGEERVVEDLRALLEAHDHEAPCFFRDSADIRKTPFGAVRAFFSGIHSPASRRALRDRLIRDRPDVVHIHNLFPLISPSILPECGSRGVPVVMTVHNYRLICPGGLLLRHGATCEGPPALGELGCALRNCERSMAKSFGYALRSFAARRRRLFLDNVSAYIALTNFQRERLIAAGYPAERIDVIPNMIDPNGVEPSRGGGRYVGFVGRVSPEKGVEVLVATARLCPDIPFKVAGAFDPASDLARRAPSNVEFTGRLDQRGIAEFYERARLIVLPSLWYEAFPLVLLEAMLRAKPVVCSRIGGLPETVDEGKSGELFAPGNPEALAQAIQRLWRQPDLCRQMGEAGREKTLREYTPNIYHQRLMAVYERACVTHSPLRMKTPRASRKATALRPR